MSSRTWVMALPEMTVLSTLASACELSPSRRASFWSIWMRTCRDGSNQSKLIVRDLWICCDDLGQLQGNVAHLRDIRAADAILHRPSDRRAKLQRGDAADQAGELVGQNLFELLPQTLARGDVLGDDHSLAEEAVRKLDVQRQIEADRAAADIGAPAHNIGVVLEDIVETARHGLAGENRRVLRQGEIDQQFGPVRRREELPGDQAATRESTPTNIAIVIAIVSHFTRIAPVRNAR